MPKYSLELAVFSAANCIVSFVILLEEFLVKVAVGEVVFFSFPLVCAETMQAVRQMQQINREDLIGLQIVLLYISIIIIVITLFLIVTFLKAIK